MPKILLVEDNEMNRDMLSRRLQRKDILLSLRMMASRDIYWRIRKGLTSF